jgi:hypothetical protein
MLNIYNAGVASHLDSLVRDPNAHTKYYLQYIKNMKNQVKINAASVCLGHFK